jgi:hypothetical protein
MAPQHSMATDFSPGCPQTSMWQTVINLIQNAFFKAVLPGFEKEIRSQSS